MFRSLVLIVSRLLAVAFLATLIACQNEDDSQDDCQDACQKMQDLCHDSLMLLAPCSSVCPLPDEALQCLSRAQTCDAAVTCAAVPTESAR